MSNYLFKDFSIKVAKKNKKGANICSAFVAFHRKTSDIPEHYREEGELVVPSYGYFIRGAQTTFTGVLRSVFLLITSDPIKQHFGSRIRPKYCCWNQLS